MNKPLRFSNASGMSGLLVLFQIYLATARKNQPSRLTRTPVIQPIASLDLNVFPSREPVHSRILQLSGGRDVPADHNCPFPGKTVIRGNRL